MIDLRRLSIPVILGTSRKGRASAHAATLLAALLNRRAGVQPQLPGPAEARSRQLPDRVRPQGRRARRSVVVPSPALVWFRGMLPVMRELGLVTIFWDINIGQIGKLFADDGRVLDDAVVRRSDRFITELIWMSTVLRYGREYVAVDQAAPAMANLVPCPCCGTAMTHHADKEVATHAGDDGIAMAAVPACAGCGAQDATIEPASAAERG